MRFATEVQGDENSARDSKQTENRGSRNVTPSNEIPDQLPENCAPQSSEYSAIAARATNDAVRDWDVKNGALTWPQGLEALLGYTEANGNIAFWQARIHPQDRSRIIASIRETFASESIHWTGEYRLRHNDGSYRDLLERASIVRNSKGEAVRLVGSLMDLTTRKQLQDQLVRSQKMEAFGQLAAGVAHDFNNYLTTILGYSDLLLDELGLKGAVADHITEIRNAAGRASVLTDQLLAFSRRHPLAPRVIEVTAFLNNLERSLLRLLGEAISVQCHLDRGKEGLHTKVDPGQLTQIILNLVVNARDAMRKGGTLTLETAEVSIGQNEDSDPDSELKPGDYVRISVTDTGVGMTDKVKQHLFEPFFTTKDDELGSGLGLATSYGIVHQSGGHILVESQVGKGTTVTILLPKVPAPPPTSYKRRHGNKTPRGTETILVLEDDVSVRHISVRVLRSLGYDVIEAATGDDAQHLIEQREPKRIHLLLTDMVMPQMSGRRFADWLHKTSPQTKVVFISGYLEESLHPGDRRGHEKFFLPKPFDSEQLAIKIREALDSTSPSS
jgi:PAS domain S-box-containing protein